MGQEAIKLFRACTPVFQTLSDPHRQDILLLLSEHKVLTVNEITNHSKLSRPAISHHLRLLKEQGLVKVEQEGTQRFYSVTLGDSVALLKQLVAALERDCL